MLFLCFSSQEECARSLLRGTGLKWPHLYLFSHKHHPLQRPCICSAIRSASPHSQLLKARPGVCQVHMKLRRKAEVPASTPEGMLTSPLTCIIVILPGLPTPYPKHLQPSASASYKTAANFSPELSWFEAQFNPKSSRCLWLYSPSSLQYVNSPPQPYLGVAMSSFHSALSPCNPRSEETEAGGW